MPEADFCSAVRSPYGHLSRRSDTKQISWGKFSHFPCTVAESTFRTLMDMDFAVSRPLVRYGRLLFGFCPSTRTFVPCFLQTPPHGGSPCIITSPFLHQDGQRTFTSWLLNMPSTQRSRSRGGRCRVGEVGSIGAHGHINFGSQGGPCDPSTKNHAGGMAFKILPTHVDDRAEVQ